MKEATKRIGLIITSFLFILLGAFGTYYFLSQYQCSGEIVSSPMLGELGLDSFSELFCLSKDPFFIIGNLLSITMLGVGATFFFRGILNLFK